MTNTIKIARMSGMAVDPANLEAFKADYRALYDKVCARFEIDQDKPKALDEKTAKRIEWILDRCKARLEKKYPRIETVAFAASKEEALLLVKKYGPLLLARSMENPEELVYVVADML